MQLGILRNKVFLMNIRLHRINGKGNKFIYRYIKDYDGGTFM